VRDPQDQVDAVGVHRLVDVVFERVELREIGRLQAIAAGGLVTDPVLEAAYELRVHRDLPALSR